MRIQALIDMYQAETHAKLNGIEEALSAELNNTKELLAIQACEMEKSILESLLLQENKIGQKAKWLNWHSEERIIKNIRSDTFITNYLIKRSLGANSSYSNKSPIYTSYFYDENRYASISSAFEVLKYLVEKLNVTSVADFGCGTGTWLYAVNAMGIDDIAGVDGDYVNRGLLLIDSEYFHPHDLRNPVRLNKNFDLVISMEVAEHLPEYDADAFVETLCAHSQQILFSAAQPGQGGDNHLNEQPIRYWISKFESRGYSYIDIRNHFNGNLKVEWWYRENMALFLKGEFADDVKEI